MSNATEVDLARKAFAEIRARKEAAAAPATLAATLAQDRRYHATHPAPPAPAPATPPAPGSTLSVPEKIELAAARRQAVGGIGKYADGSSYGEPGAGRRAFQEGLARQLGKLNSR